MARNITVGIDIGTRSTRVVVAERTKETPSTKILGIGVSTTSGVRHGYIINQEEARKSIRLAIRAAEKSSNVKIKNAFISVGGISLESTISNGSIMISRADNEVTDLDIEKAVTIAKNNLNNIANKRIIYTIPLHFKLDGKDVLGRATGMSGEKLEVKILFVTCLAHHVDDLINAVEDAGVEVEDIVASPIAASLVALTRKQRAVGSLLANIGAETVSVSVFEDDIPISLKVFPIGSTDITNDIALGLQVTLEEAEKIKTAGRTNMYSKRKLDDIVEARLSDIFELIGSHLKKIKRHGLLPAGIIITGGGAGILSIENFAKASLELPSKIATHKNLKDVSENNNDSSWFVAYGLCIYGFQQFSEKDTFNILRSMRINFVSWVKQFLP